MWNTKNECFWIVNTKMKKNFVWKIMITKKSHTVLENFIFQLLFTIFSSYCYSSFDGNDPKKMYEHFWLINFNTIFTKFWNLMIRNKQPVGQLFLATNYYSWGAMKSQSIYQLSRWKFQSFNFIIYSKISII